MATHRESDNLNSDAKKIEATAPTESKDLSQSEAAFTQVNGTTSSTSQPVTSARSEQNNQGKNKFPTTKNRAWWQAWQIWGILLVFMSGGVGFAATSVLLKLPRSQNCSKVFWPVASASIRIYCAQTAAREKTVTDLLQAIDLVAVLPESHPLRPEINRNIEKWARSILEIGEEKFQSGKLEEAISIVQRVPKNVEARSVVDEKVEQWQTIWSQGEEIYNQVDEHLHQANWNEAFSWAVRLTDSKNQYWATTKYQESIDNINIAQEENATLDKAQTQLTKGNINDLLKAIDKAEDIPKNSYAYQQAKKIMVEGKEKIVGTIENLVKQQNWRELLQITNRLPYSLGLQDEVREWNILASAGTSADLGTVFGLEDAIAEASKLDSASPHYEKTQKMIARWRLEIKDVKQLSQAKQLARGENIENLQAAIAEASKIPNSNPRYQEARREITKWQDKIQTIEDRPILNRAKELAFANNVEAWRRAIAEANLITPSSPLYQEAQRSARSWRTNIEREEDQPLLDQALSFASSKNYSAAIESAQKIRSGRALYPEAQRKINTWNKEIQADQYLRDAYTLENQRTPQALAKAIKVARQVSSSSSRYSEVISNVNDWSRQILAAARQASDSSLEQAIAIAQLIPSGTNNYQEVQNQIQTWETKLRSAQTETTPLPPGFKLDKQKEKSRI